MKDETRNERGSRGRGRGARAKTETTTSVPLVSAKRGKFTPLTDTRVEAVVYARLMDYKEFVREMEGEEPDEGAIVSAGLEMLFNADQLFERWQNDQRKKSRQPDDSHNAKSTTRSAVTSTVGVGST